VLLERLLREPFAVYEVTAAIRGPDIRALGLKNVFTERIRYWVFGGATLGKTRFVPWISVQTYKDALQELRKGRRDKEIKHALQHYLMHVSYALKVLHREGIDEAGLLRDIAETMLGYLGGTKELRDVAKKLKEIVAFCARCIYFDKKEGMCEWWGVREEPTGFCGTFEPRGFSVDSTADSTEFELSV